MNQLKVIIADDHLHVRKAWSLLLAERADIKVIGEATSGVEVINILKASHANLVIMDIDMPGMNGVQTAEEISSNHPWTKVLVLTMHKEKSYIKKMFQLGAHGYITKNATPEELYTAIDTIRKGEKYLSPEVQTVLLEEFSYNLINPSHKPGLSEREIEIIKLISEGLTSFQISEKLFLSIKTVESHRGNIYKKLGVKNVAEMLKIAKSKFFI